MDNQEIKMDLLIDVLNKKAKLLDNIFNITANQQALLKNSCNTLEIKNLYLEMGKEKQILIDNTIKSDKIFNNIFEGVSSNLNQCSSKYKDKFKLMQSLIKAITDIDYKIRVLESQNSQIKKQFFNNDKIFDTNNILDKYKQNCKKAN